MIILITFSTIIHASLFAYDEYILKKQRTLSVFEINSGIVDGVLYLAAVGITLFSKYSDNMSYLYILLSALSCLSIVKNELFYPLNSQRLERVIHSALYILHPVILYCFYLLWKMNLFANDISYWILQLCYFVLGVKMITYHIVYWHYIHDKKNKRKLLTFFLLIPSYLRHLKINNLFLLELEKMKDNIIKLNEHISLLNIDLKIEETHKLLELLLPIKELLYADAANSLFFYFSGTRFHAESFIKVNGQFGSAHVQAFNIDDLIKKLIPDVLNSIKKPNLFPKSKQLNL